MAQSQETLRSGMNFRSLNRVNEVNPSSFGAHDISPFEGKDGYLSLGRLDMPPKPNENLTNLDEIVEWYAKFYELK